MLTEGTWEWAKEMMRRGHCVKRPDWSLTLYAMEDDGTVIIGHKEYGKFRFSRGFYTPRGDIRSDWMLSDHLRHHFNLSDL